MINEAEIKALLDKARQGDTASQLRVAQNYYGGKNGFATDIPQAIYWFQTAANNNNVIAQYNLGLMYLSGYGVPKDIKQAMELFKQAALQNHLNAQYKLIELYLKEIDTPGNFEEGLAWAKKAIENGGDLKKISEFCKKDRDTIIDSEGTALMRQHNMADATLHYLACLKTGQNLDYYYYQLCRAYEFTNSIYSFELSYIYVNKILSLPVSADKTGLTCILGAWQRKVILEKHVEELRKAIGKYKVQGLHLNSGQPDDWESHNKEARHYPVQQNGCLTLWGEIPSIVFHALMYIFQNEPETIKSLIFEERLLTHDWLGDELRQRVSEPQLATLLKELPNNLDIEMISCLSFFNRDETPKGISEALAQNKVQKHILDNLPDILNETFDEIYNKTDGNTNITWPLRALTYSYLTSRATDRFKSKPEVSAVEDLAKVVVKR